MASYYFILYTFVSSFFLFFYIVYMFSVSSCSFILAQENFSNFEVIGFIFCLAFIIKIPIYPFHLWLLKTHLESPVIGSMILAGVLLKVGCYGLMRFFYIHRYVLKHFLPVSVLGSIIISLNCLRSQDYKLIVANSSVVHICFCYIMIMQRSFLGYTGCLLIILSHGLCSSGLFFISNLFYQNCGSRRFMILKGLFCCSPYLCIWLFFLLACNISSPPTFNFVRELYSIIVSFSLCYFIVPLCVVIAYICACFCIYYYYLAINSSLGQTSVSILNDFSLCTRVVISLHLLFLVSPFFFLLSV